VVPGFRLSGLRAGIKKREGLDLGLVVADAPVPAAGVFTLNAVRAAPVLLAEERVAAGRVQAVLANSGCANAATGKEGLKAAREACAAVARELRIPEASVVPASTGVIGQLLPADKVAAAAPQLVASLEPGGADAFSRAILTTDAGPKVAQARVRVAGGTVTVLGVAKGAGMIHPNMATTLGFVLTDARLPAPLLRRLLKGAADATFNAISVDGDTSTNDTLLLLASGRTGAAPLRASDRDTGKLAAALEEVLGQLARKVVADGEGAEHLVTVEVLGAASEKDARAAARTIVTSPLVKTALHGKDPNWGRILAAAGRSGARFDPDRVEIRVGGIPIVRRGIAVGPEAEKQAHQVMSGPEYTIEVRLGAGTSRARYLTCDLSAEYVRINADYRS
jgi:glutamate N-acetyltransferase/amino-acid N-acetyltransferase